MPHAAYIEKKAKELREKNKNPKGMHQMPGGHMMKDSEMKEMSEEMPEK